MTDDQLKEWKRLAEAATPGPWKGELDVFDPIEGIVATVDDDRVDMLASINTGVESHYSDGPWTEADEALKKEQWAKAKQSQALKDATFIAAAREAVPALIAEVEALRAEVKRLRGD